MARPLEPITAAKALEALADNSRSTHPAERLIIPVIPRDSTMGPIPHVEAQALMRGMDWENNCMILTPEQPLTVLTPDEVRDIQLSMRQGGNWHSYQRHQKQQDKIDLLEAQRDAVMKAMEDLLCQSQSDTSSQQNVRTREEAQAIVKAIVDNAKPRDRFTKLNPVRR
jgi:hypothetical protein